MEKQCIFCGKNLKNSTRSTIQRGAIEKIIERSQEKGDNLHEALLTLNVLQTHLRCRNMYVFNLLRLFRAHYIK